MYLHGNAVSYLEFVYACPEFCDGTHVFMARREILVEGEPSLYPGRVSFG
jgi:hypothetical protein